MPTAKQLAEADSALGRMDWSRLDGMSDEEIRAAWAWDADTSWPTEAELQEFKLVPGSKTTARDAAE